MSEQLVLRNVFTCFWCKYYQNIVLCHSMTIRQNFCGEVTNFAKPGFSAQLSATESARLGYLYNFVETETNVWSRFPMGLSKKIMEFEAKQAYRGVSDGSLSLKFREKKHNFQLSSLVEFCDEANWRVFMSDACSYFEPQMLPTVHARNQKKSWSRKLQNRKDRSPISVLKDALQYCNTHVFAWSGYMTKWENLLEKGIDRDW